MLFLQMDAAQERQTELQAQLKMAVLTEHYTRDADVVDMACHWPVQATDCPQSVGADACLHTIRHIIPSPYSLPPYHSLTLLPSLHVPPSLPFVLNPSCYMSS